MIARTLLSLVAAYALVLGTTGVRAQAPSPPSDAVKALGGAWELSNADRDLTCAVTFKVTPVRAGLALDWDKGCANVFPLTKEVVAWALGKNDAIQLLDARGKILLELTEVESGLYEGLRPGDPLYFLQSQAAVGTDKTADQMIGNWAFVRGAARPLCELTLANEVADAPDTFALSIKPGCDAQIANFAPKSWQMDRGQLVVFSAKGEAWRFEEAETDTWQRIPAGRQPLSLVKR